MFNDIYVHPSSVIDKNVEIGEGTKIWHFCHVCEGAKIGENCTIGQNVYIGPKVTIGSGCKIQNNVSIYEGVTLDDHVFCGPSCVFTNDPYPEAYNPDRSRWRLTHVEKGASIGANATIICGVTIGQFSLVGAGSVVTKTTLPFSIVKGNPAI